MDSWCFYAKFDENALNTEGYQLGGVHHKPINEDPHTDKKQTKKEFVGIFFQIFFDEKVEAYPPDK